MVTASMEAHTAKTAPQDLEDLQHAVDEALWEYDPVRGALWELKAVVQPAGVVEVGGHVRSRSIRDGVLEVLGEVPAVDRIVDRMITDPDLEMRVARELAKVKQIPPGAVAVHSHLGKLTLVGKLADDSSRTAAVQTAQEVSGVRGVDDRLQVG